MFRGWIRTWIEPRQEVSKSPEQTSRQNPCAKILMESLIDGGIGQIRLLQDLPAVARILRQHSLVFHHQPRVLVQCFEDLLSRSGHVIQIIGDNVSGTPR